MFQQIHDIATECHGIPQHDVTCHDFPRLSTACHGNPQHDAASRAFPRPSTTSHSIPQHDASGCGQSANKATSHAIKSKSSQVQAPVKKSSSHKIALPIVPVYVRGSSNDKIIETFALLDPGSNMTFCSQALIKQLKIKGSSQTLSLSTLNAEKMSMPSL